MTNTQGLDALAALCGSTAVASEENGATVAATAIMPANNSAAATAPSQFAAASLYAQAQMQQQAQAQALQLQHVQQVLAMRQALQDQHQAQQQQQAAVAQAAALQGQAQAQAMASALPPQLVQQQLGMLQAAAAQQQQQQQQQQQVNAYNQVQQALAAQLLAQQQQQQRQHQQQQQQQRQLASAAAGVHPSLTALSPALSPALASLAAASGGQVIPGAAAALSQDAVVVSSPTLQAPANSAQSSPSILSMPPPPNVLVPSLPLSNNPATKAIKARDDTDNAANEQSPTTATASSKRRPRATTEAVATPEPPIQDMITEWEDKKQAKRAANRLSAHLSRKRKKMFLDDLRDENVELRRKEQILRSIPDLIAVFDSSGCISFISFSVTRFLDYTVEELNYSSFWDLLTEDSVRLIKSSFMDALAIKRPQDEDSTPLANGESMTVKLVNKKDGNEEVKDDGLLVSLKGMVHFTGESPECVCSIRPEGNITGRRMDIKKLKRAVKESSPPPASARVQQIRTAAVPVGAPVSHQISDINSEKS